MYVTSFKLGKYGIHINCYYEGNILAITQEADLGDKFQFANSTLSPESISSNGSSSDLACVDSDPAKCVLNN